MLLLASCGIVAVRDKAHTPWTGSRKEPSAGTGPVFRAPSVRVAASTTSAVASLRRGGKAPKIHSGMSSDERWMREALQLAGEAAASGEVPVGAVIVRDDGIIARAANRTLRDQDPTGHA